jgi:hypothetical protein
LLGELEYKVTKIIFGLDKQEPWVNIPSTQPSPLEKMEQSSNENPLFTQPKKSQNRRPASKKWKNKIRV